MEPVIWLAFAALCAAIPLILFCALLYYAHYHSKNKYLRFLFYVIGIVGGVICLRYLYLISCVPS